MFIVIQPLQDNQCSDTVKLFNDTFKKNCLKGKALNIDKIVLTINNVTCF